MPKVVILVGLPASGKSTYARKLVGKGNYTRVNKDDLREMLHASGKEGDRGFRGKLENTVLSIRDSIIIKALRSGQNVVVDDTNLDPKHIDRISEVVEAQQELDREYLQNPKLKYTWEVKVFDTPLEDCIKRDMTRSKPVGERVIREMHNKYLRPLKRVTQDENAPQAVIFDMDGTLALLNGRDPYDASTCEYDLPNYPVIDVLRKYQKDGYKIIICSGRKDEFAEQTGRWLDKFDIKPDLLLMRVTDDNRNDSIVKEEMFKNHILGKYYVEVVYDDRERVVDTWRDLGLTCFQVSDGRF